MKTERRKVGLFRSLQWKLVTVFMLLILSIMFLSGAFILLRMTYHHHRVFAGEMEGVFNSSLIYEMERESVSDGEYVIKKMRELKNPLGIDAERNYYIISAETGGFVDGTVVPESDFYIDSENYISARSGNTGNKANIANFTMDFAVPLNTPDGNLIIYVKDSNKDLEILLTHTFYIIVQALVLGVVVSIIIGFWFSRAITKPIKNLTKRALSISEGEFDQRAEVINRNDEIGVLSETFNEMSDMLQGTLSDISTEKSKIEAILQNMTDGVIAFGTDGKIIHINSMARKILGIKGVEKFRFDKLFSLLGADILIGDLLYLDNRRNIETEVTKGDLALKINLTVFDDKRNRTSGVLAVIHDITKQQKLENSRREFVANVSHELRTPLTTVKSYAETLLDFVKDDKTSASFTNTILNETDRMTRLVKDLLVLSSLENTASLNKAEFSLKAMINDVVSTMSLVAQEKGHRLQFNQSEDIPDYYGDRDKLEQVLYNIISNAIKYTPNGGKIIVSAKKVYNEIYIEVTDTGIGIPEKDLSRIFERFYRVDKARSRELGGTGLGLAISKSIIDSHGGNIEIQSTYGKGTTVIISLPIKNK